MSSQVRNLARLVTLRMRALQVAGSVKSVGALLAHAWCLALLSWYVLNERAAGDGGQMQRTTAMAAHKLAGLSMFILLLVRVYNSNHVG